MLLWEEGCRDKSEGWRQSEKDDVVLVYEAMKMENDILSTLEGTVKRILVKENDVVGTNEPLIEFE